MKTILKKLKSKAGESLVETLAAILIFALASVIMYSMVTTAGKINATAKEMDAQNQAHLVAVEKGEESYKNGTAMVRFTIGAEEIARTTVDIYGGQNDSLFTYFVQTGG